MISISKCNISQSLAQPVRQNKTKELSCFQKALKYFADHKWYATLKFTATWASAQSIATVYGNITDAKARLVFESFVQKNTNFVLDVVAQGDRETLRTLLNMDNIDNPVNTALDYAIRGNHIEIAAWLMQQPRLNLEGKEPLLWAITENYPELANKLLTSYASSVDEVGTNGDMLLMWAVEKGHKETVRLLIEKGADIEARSLQHKSPLYLAIRAGNEEMVELLLKKGANPNFRDINKRSLLEHAICAKNTEIVQHLVTHGASLDVDTEKYSPPVVWAIAKNNLGALNVLIERGQDLNMRYYGNDFPECRGKNLLELAMHLEKIEAIELLVQAGALLPTPTQAKEYSKPVQKMIESCRKQRAETVKAVKEGINERAAKTDLFEAELSSKILEQLVPF